MNRVKAINLYSIPSGDIIGQALKVGTVLDGELVVNLSRNRPVFLVFDVLCNEGVNVSQFLFDRRLAILNNEVMKKCGAIVGMHQKANMSGKISFICNFTIKFISLSNKGTATTIKFTASGTNACAVSSGTSTTSPTNNFQVSGNCCVMLMLIPSAWLNYSYCWTVVSSI
jgi:non-ribosomal peptide synthetase component E (peptide arylation enzyme)